MELEDQSRRIISILTNMSNENKFVNSIMARKEDIDKMIDSALVKKKKEIEAICNKNNEVEKTIINDTDDKTWENLLDNLMVTEAKIKSNINSLQIEERELSIKLANILEDKENLVESETKDILSREKKAQKLKKLAQLYVNFTRIRWVKDKEKPTCFLSLADKEFKKIEVESSENKSKMVNQYWDKISQAVLEDRA